MERTNMAGKLAAGVGALIFLAGISTAMSAPTGSLNTYFRGQPQDASACAKVHLTAIYGAEKQYSDINGVYSELLSEIQYLANQGFECGNWQSPVVRTFGRGTEFQATITHRFTGETWTIDQDKLLIQVRAGI